MTKPCVSPYVCALKRWIAPYRDAHHWRWRFFRPGKFAYAFVRPSGLLWVDRIHSLAFGFDLRDDESLRVPHACRHTLRRKDGAPYCGCFREPAWSNRLRQFDHIIGALDQSLIDAGLGRVRLCKGPYDDGVGSAGNAAYAHHRARLDVALGARTVRAHLTQFVHPREPDCVGEHEQPSEWVLDVSDRHWLPETDSFGRPLFDEDKQTELMYRPTPQLLQRLYEGDITPDETLRAATMAMARGIAHHPLADYLVYGGARGDFQPVPHTEHRMMDFEPPGMAVSGLALPEGSYDLRAPCAADAGCLDAAREAARDMAVFDRGVLVFGEALTPHDVLGRLRAFGSGRGARVEPLAIDGRSVEAAVHVNGARYAIVIACFASSDGHEAPHWSARTLSPLMAPIGILLSRGDWGAIDRSTDVADWPDAFVPLQTLVLDAVSQWGDLVCWYTWLTCKVWRRAEMPEALFSGDTG